MHVIGGTSCADGEEGGDETARISSPDWLGMCVFNRCVYGERSRATVVMQLRLGVLVLGILAAESSICKSLKKCNCQVTKLKGGVQLDRCQPPASVDQINLISVNILSIKKGAFAGLDITHLDLRGNRIRLEEGAFAELQTLEQLDLRSNGINALPAKTFMGLKGLKKLDLRKNRIHTLSPGQFDGLEALQKLFLHENVIYRIQEGTFDKLVLLKDLYLHKNNLEALESASVFNNLPAVSDLDLDMNPMTKKKKCPDKTAKKKQKVGGMRLS
jgi:hypothetical protein